MTVFKHTRIKYTHSQHFDRSSNAHYPNLDHTSPNEKRQNRNVKSAIKFRKSTQSLTGTVLHSKKLSLVSFNLRRSIEHFTVSILLQSINWNHCYSYSYYYSIYILKFKHFFSYRNKMHQWRTAPTK